MKKLLLKIIAWFKELFTQREKIVLGNKDLCIPKVDTFEEKQRKTVFANKTRRALKYSKSKHPESYYFDTDVYTNKNNSYFKAVGNC